MDSMEQTMAKGIHGLGLDFLQAGRFREAAFQFRKALNIAPEYQDAALCLGHCLHLLGEYEAALPVYEQLLAISSSNAAAWNNRGNTLLVMCRYAEAAASYSRALEIAPDLLDAQVALATCFQALGQLEKAMAACNAVLAAAPDNAEVHWNRALLLLLKGEYREGWREYEWRWQKRDFTSPRRNFVQPCWQGEPLVGRTILIHAEQGFGDTLQFCRYVPLVAELGAKVVFECHPQLVPLMENLAGDICVVAMGQPLPPFDLTVPLLSLPLVFGTTVETIPDRVPYLTAPVARLPFWRAQIVDTKCFRIGLCWAGKSYPDPGRSCPTDLLAPLAEIKGMSWHSLQVGWDKPLPLPMTDCTGQIRDFGDTAALIAQLDLVITVDTAVAHLAGALGKPVWVMLPHSADWRWLLNRQDSPWYPTMRIFRQARLDSWQNAIQLVACSLVGKVA